MTARTVAARSTDELKVPGGAIHHMLNARTSCVVNCDFLWLWLCCIYRRLEGVLPVFVE
jgi:hypothetical protein